MYFLKSRISNTICEQNINFFMANKTNAVWDCLPCNITENNVFVRGSWKMDSFFLHKTWGWEVDNFFDLFISWPRAFWQVLNCIFLQVHWVQCDGCELWLHLNCVGLRPSDVCEDEDFICRECKPIRKPKVNYLQILPTL